MACGPNTSDISFLFSFLILRRMGEIQALRFPRFHIYIYQINMYFVRHLNPTIPLQQRLTLLLPVTWACRPDLIPRDPVRWGSTHKQKPRLWTLPARLGPVTVHPIYPLARWSSCLVSLYLRVLRIFRFCGDCKELRGARTRIDRDWWNTHWNARPKECSTPSANS